MTNRELHVLLSKVVVVGYFCFPPLLLSHKFSLFLENVYSVYLTNEHAITLP